ncbi:MAG: exodeoxyribonuclease VII large subunit, partial [Desulfovibrionaceae bacterium]|nr:exodeoxyribonuclease VII large subunit [Desulfovibrionaceae bacterium]
MPQPSQYTVSQLNRAVELALKKNIGAAGMVKVVGEIGSYKVSSSVYGRMVFFSLHEGEESINCFVGGRDLQRLLGADPLTGEILPEPRRIEEVFASERRVMVEGCIGTYCRRGNSNYRISVTGITDLGAGDRARQLRLLMERLRKEGFFADERKRPLPPNPTCIALVTSPRGAVIHDFLRTAEDRGFGCRMRLYPVRVQGETAGPEIARAVAAAGRDGKSQVVVVIRGGGSEDDLACFNDETLARAIFACPVPVLAGIGHETDNSLADMTADKRASTPTQAAQILWTPRSDIRDVLDGLKSRADTAVTRLLENMSDRLRQHERMVRACSPKARLKNREEALGDLAGRLAAACQRLESRADRALTEAAEDLTAAGGRFLAPHGRALADSGARLMITGTNLCDTAGRELEHLALRLAAASPLAPLEKGFALLQDENGHVLRSV